MGDRRTMWRRRWGSNPHVTDLQSLIEWLESPDSKTVWASVPASLQSSLQLAFEDALFLGLALVWERLGEDLAKKIELLLDGHPNRPVR